MATTQFSCCTCPESPGYDPEVDAPLPKYRNKCGCPTATLVCESKEKKATLVGTFDGSDFTNNTVYKVETITFPCRGDTAEKRINTAVIGFESVADCPGPDAFTVSGDHLWYPSKICSRFESSSCSGTTEKTYEYSDPDTEAAAIARAKVTEAEGPCDTSIYQIRGIRARLIFIRTVKFSLELTNLCRGRAYEGCARIRKRKAFSGIVPDGEVVEWEDVEPFTFGPITPSAANTTDGVTTTAEITDQDLVGGTEDARGWEYEIVSAHVWPVSAGCDCPTELGYTDP